jgi:hypothetical protein
MPLFLSDAELAELDGIVGEFRHKDAVQLLKFLAPRVRQAAHAQARVEAPTPAIPPRSANGHSDNQPNVVAGS